MHNLTESNDVDSVKIGGIRCLIHLAVRSITYDISTYLTLCQHFSRKMSKIAKILPGDHVFTAPLAQLDAAPAQLYAVGQLPKERLPTVAIVGSRKPTRYGREVTERLAGNLARRGAVIVSGLALGIDAIAQKAAIEARGTTIAVLANGLHRIYPASNRQLAKDIVARGGAIVSEYEEGIEPMKHRFLERNRLVSGLADIVVITEAAGRSGTLNTAGHAIEQGRELYAVPGPITSPMSAGCNAIIRQGATPLVDIDEFVGELFAGQSPDQLTAPIGDTPLEQAIIDALLDGMRDGDQIQAALDVSAAEFSTALTMLEINGVIVPLGANQWRLG